LTDEVSSEYLAGEDLARYGRIESIVKTEYAEVLASIKDPAKLPYTAVIYVIPWVLIQEVKRGSMTARGYHYNLIFVDPKNFERYAIFSVLNFLDRFQDYISGGLGHEVAHIIQTKGRIELELPEIYRYIENSLQVEMKKEVDAEEFYDLFNEPIRSAIRKWNKLSKYPEIKKEVCYDAEVVDMKKFLRLIFGDKESEFENYMRQKITKEVNTPKS
jgi:hypothetical protein